MNLFVILGLKKLPEQAQTDTKDSSFVVVNYSSSVEKFLNVKAETSFRIATSTEPKP